jgi:para-nitrobenzyl esterase
MAGSASLEGFDMPATHVGRSAGSGLIRRCVVGLSLAVCVTSFAQQPSAPTVAVSGGRIQGRTLPMPGGAVFKGIPYAAPPVGEMRWRETQPVKPWKDLLQAGEFRNGCGQTEPGAGEAGPATEDCLYLNVWAPTWPARGRQPVILWINGGELFGGSGALKSGVESLVHRGVILVSANYRGTLLGMMGHPELTAESPHHSSANYMLFDEVAVLRWIHDNIGRFGGDPANVTVFGQSGGAHVISMLLASPFTKGLIQRAIIDSGAPMQGPRPFLHLEELEQIGEVTAQVLKAPATGTIRYLRSLPAAEVVAAMPAVRAKLLEMNGEAYDEGTDGYVIPQPPGEVWSTHREPPVPMMMGNTSQDTAATIRGETVPGPNASAKEVAAWETNILQLFYGDTPDLLETALQNYGLRGAPNEVLNAVPYGSPVQQLGVDFDHRCGTQLSAALHSTLAPTWLFEFSRTTHAHLPTHGSELRYVFGYDDLEDTAERRQSEIIQGYWTNFARTGNPNGPGLPDWPKYDAAKKTSLEFSNEGPVQKSAFRAVACAPYVEKYARDPKPLTGGIHTYIRGPAITR